MHHPARLHRLAYDPRVRCVECKGETTPRRQ